MQFHSIVSNLFLSVFFLPLSLFGYLRCFQKLEKIIDFPGFLCVHLNVAHWISSDMIKELCVHFLVCGQSLNQHRCNKTTIEKPMFLWRCVLDVDRLLEYLACTMKTIYIQPIFVWSYSSIHTDGRCNASSSFEIKRVLHISMAVK